MDPRLLGLPHRPPFCFLDDVVDLEPGISAHGVKTFDATEAFFAGHFPGNPIVPGVILTEALAQLAGVAAAAGEPGATFLLSAIRQMKFPRAARPGETLQLSAQSVGGLGLLAQFDVRAEVDGAVVAAGSLMLNRSTAP